MIDLFGGFDCVNNILFMLNFKFVNLKSFKYMERWVMVYVEVVVKMLIWKVVIEVFEKICSKLSMKLCW